MKYQIDNYLNLRVLSLAYPKCRSKCTLSLFRLSPVKPHVAPFGKPSLVPPVFKYICILVILLIFNFAFLIFNSSEARAQTLSLSLSPPIIEVLIKPGRSITQGYKLINSGETAIVTAKMVEITGNGIKENKEFVAENWITIVSPGFFFDRPFLMKSGEEKEIVLRIAPPKDLAEQDLYRALIFTTSPLPAGESSQSAASITVGTILLLQISPTGMLTKEAQITRFNLPTLIDSFGPIKANIEVKNTGKTYFRTLGKITLTGAIGKGEYPLLPETILTNETKKLTAEKLSSDDFSLVLPGFFLGKYSLGVSFSLGEGNIVISAGKTFYGVPWKAGLAVIGVLMLVKLTRSFKRKSQKKS